LDKRASKAKDINLFRHFYYCNLPFAKIGPRSNIGLRLTLNLLVRVLQQKGSTVAPLMH